MVPSMTARCPGPAAAMLCLVFPTCDAVHYGQLSPLWLGLSKGPFSRSTVICLDETLET